MHGIPAFKSSKVAIWPLYFLVSELPCAHRISRSNMIVAGLWFGRSKPNMLTCLKPFHSSLKELENNGIHVKHSWNLLPLIITFDGQGASCEEQQLIDQFFSDTKVMKIHSRFWNMFSYLESSGTRKV